MARARHKPPALSFERRRRQLQKIRRCLALARYDRTLYLCVEQVGHRAQPLEARAARQESNQEVHSAIPRGRPRSCRLPISMPVSSISVRNPRSRLNSSSSPCQSVRLARAARPVAADRAGAGVCRPRARKPRSLRRRDTVLQRSQGKAPGNRQVPRVNRAERVPLVALRQSLVHPRGRHPGLRRDVANASELCCREAFNLSRKALLRRRVGHEVLRYIGHVPAVRGQPEP